MTGDEAELSEAVEECDFDENVEAVFLTATSFYKNSDE